MTDHQESVTMTTMKPAGRGPEVVGVYSFFLALTTLTIFLRVYCRLVLVKNFGLDDWFGVIAWIFFVFFGTFAITGAYHGTGQHAALIDPPTLIPVGLKWWWACEPVYVLSNMALKASISVMLLRLAVLPIHRIIIWITLGVIELYSAFFFFLFVFQCRPSAYFWTQYTGGKGTCIDAQILVDATYGFTAISCAGDWILALLPVFLVWNLQMNARVKVSVALILGLGAVASTATIIRIPYVHTLKNKADFLYATTDVAIWSCCETGIGIAASSIATMRPLFRDFFARSKLFGGSTSGRASKGWKSDGTSAGYIRSHDRQGTEEFGLRSDIGKSRGVQTTIESDGTNHDLEKELQGAKRGLSGSSKESQRKLRKDGGWHTGESKDAVHRNSDDDELPNWANGIRKATVYHQVID